jgi:Family of unknown function (DUF6461)
MTATPEYYANVVEGFLDTESLTVLFAAGVSVAEVAAVLDVDLDTSKDLDDVFGDTQATAWALLDVPGGVVAVEPTGFGDPTRAALVELSRDGRASAVVRNNVLAHLRFGCARDGRLVFDDNEYMYVPDPAAAPEELRPLIDLVWQKIGDEDEEPGPEEEGPDGLPVALAMAETVTGVAVTSEDVEAIQNARYHPAPTLRYARELI